MKLVSSNAKQAITKALPVGLLSDKGKRQMITAFAERSNMVYFGYVSQLSDEHRIVRGLTVSNQHRDDHYCIGTYHDYDVVFVERSDTIQAKQTHVWHILEFDLHTTIDLPHIFVGSSQDGLGFHTLLNAKYRAFVPAQLGMTGLYPAEFTNHFSLYVNPSLVMQAETLIDPEAARLLGNHFRGLVAEIDDGRLYIYSERPKLSGELLDTMIANGTWLARHIDEKSQRL